MSIQALSWALGGTHEAPAHLRMTLVGLANHADDEGRGAYPSVARLQAYTGRSARQVQYDLRGLLDLGLIREGDPRFVAHLRSDRRPQVYDLVIPVRGAISCTPDVERGAISDATRCNQRQSGVQPIAPKPSLNRPEPKTHVGDESPTRREDVERLCAHLAARVVANGSKAPTITRTWQDAARLLLDADGRTEEQVHRAIDHSQDSEFWRKNILSMTKLREKYDQLRLDAIDARSRAAATNGAGPRDHLPEYLR